MYNKFVNFYNNLTVIFIVTKLSFFVLYFFFCFSRDRTEIKKENYWAFILDFLCCTAFLKNTTQITTPCHLIYTQITVLFVIDKLLFLCCRQALSQTWIVKIRSFMSLSFFFLSNIYYLKKLYKLQLCPFDSQTNYNR